MSWAASLVDDRGHLEGEWHYTHNTSPMIYAVLEDAGVVLASDPSPCRVYDRVSGKWTDHPESHGTIPWWKHLDGLSGPEGAAFLHLVIRGLEADPMRFEAMNPENGWGSYDVLLMVLCDMCSAVPEWPTTWEVGG